MIGLIGSFICYVIVYPLEDSAEPIVLYFSSTTLAAALLVFMNLSGFKPK